MRKRRQEFTINIYDTSQEKEIYEYNVEDETVVHKKLSKH